MSQRDRTIQWCEGKILEVLGRKNSISSLLVLSACVLQNVRSINEQHNLDIALVHLISQKKVLKMVENGDTVYKLVA